MDGAGKIFLKISCYYLNNAPTSKDKIRIKQKEHLHDFNQFSSPLLITLRCLVHVEELNFEETAETQKISSINQKWTRRSLR